MEMSPTYLRYLRQPGSNNFLTFLFPDFSMSLSLGAPPPHFSQNSWCVQDLKYSNEIKGVPCRANPASWNWNMHANHQGNLIKNPSSDSRGLQWAMRFSDTAGLEWHLEKQDLDFIGLISSDTFSSKPISVSSHLLLYQLLPPSA